MFNDLSEVIKLHYLFLSAMLFFSGIYLAPIAVEKELDVVLKYPRWIFKTMERYFKPNLSFGLIFLIIYFFNNLSLFSSFALGYLIVTPAMLAFVTGFNIGVVSFDLMGWRGIGQILLNPVAWLEFPAAWLSFTLSFEVAEYQWNNLDLQKTNVFFTSLLPVYFKYIASMLLIAAILETAMIVYSRQFMDKDE